MAWFNRNKTQQNVLPEIESYYDAERRERAGLTWLMALVSIACVALLIIGLFFGGRWLYRKIANTPATQGVSVTDTSDSSSGLAKTSDTSGSGSSKGSGTPSTTPSATTTPTYTVPASSTASTATNPATTKLADTGPGNTVAVFIIATLSFAAIHLLFTRLFRA